ncbi:uncharacterized protein LOC105645548 isoform X2 [Jatropha curcas]|uniref:uncharacterized protein LOC105645548 isoform X2 n=1 Tax=Jatropha curcas TaxID=180498 RepID=UPI0005FC1956|nr:uncharacterized protein LOC105645548 isoform X2 [Jatropha curcas]
MGAGRKTRTITMKEKIVPPWTVNGIDTARNLRTNDLTAVIFGCKHNTIKECFSNQLFGLPAPHNLYVRNIYPGMLLFLFNYSDRKLHGIFEAASHGRLNINPHAWTEDGSDSSPYPAQVKFRIATLCQPLVEDQYGPIIAENYYKPKLFWFELDKDQTSKLVSLFCSSPMTQKQSPLFKGSFIPNATEKQRQEGEISNNEGRERAKEVASVKPSPGLSYSSVVKNMSSSVKTDQSLVKCGTYIFDQSKTALGVCSANAIIVQDSSACPSLIGERQQLKAVDVAENHKHEAVCGYPSANGSSSSHVDGMGASLPQKPWSALFNNETASDADARREAEDSKVPTLESKFSEIDQCSSEWEPSPDLNQKINVLDAAVSNEDSEPCESLTIVDTRQEAEDLNIGGDQYNLEWSSSCVSPRLDEEHQTSELLTDGYVPQEELYSESNWESLYVAMANMVIAEDHQREVAKVHSREAIFSEIKSSDFHSIVAKLLLEREELKGSQFMQVESKIEIQQLKDRCKALEARCINFDDLMLIAGGFDGSLWLSSLEFYSPFHDLKKPLASMNSVRSYASAANLNGELFIIGGVHGSLWYDTVESYNPTCNQWSSRPSLNQRRGHLASVSLHDKIFAVGGGNGVGCLSEVEMLDVNAGRWIPVRSMLDKRFAPAAAEISGILYVVGGYNGSDYLNSVERFDPREHSWTRLESLTVKRGCHSLTVLNEKLYALGGYDGHNMVSTVEVFDPRVGLWTMEECMSESRGYFGAVVMRDSIYVIGGLNDNGKPLDKGEYYKEGHGWKASDLKGIGNRCFFSAAVL